jgi:hypothetical protein
MAGQRINLGGKGDVLQASKHGLWCSSYLAGKKNWRPSQGLSRVVDGEGMVQIANLTLRLRTASAAASANLKRPVRVRLYPRAPCFAPALSCRH